MRETDRMVERLRAYDARPVRIMEVCGTHTSSIIKNGIREFLPPSITLVSGPGCPVCVTPPGYIDALVGLSMRADTEILTFGDMLKVPGSELSLSDAKARGGHVRMVYSPLQALELAAESPETQFIFAAVGFETTAPVYCVLMESIIAKKIGNIKLATGIKAITPALDFICENEQGIDAFICPGHVSVIIGCEVFGPLCEKYKKPFVVTGFDGADIVASILEILRQLESGEYSVRNLYKSAVSDEGNPRALALIDKYFVQSDSLWRGIGPIPMSGLRLRGEFADLDAGSGEEFELPPPPGCRCGDVILGRISPGDCPLYGTACSPESPVGPCMVSAEGACGIWYAGGLG